MLTWRHAGAVAGLPALWLAAAIALAPAPAIADPSSGAPSGLAAVADPGVGEPGDAAKLGTRERVNGLSKEASPYLLMHSRDPVDWLPWGEEALDSSRRQDKLLYVSVGYFSCHWCHVMHRESFQDPAIAAFLNEHFVAVKVDRELNPALDAHLLEFVQATRGRAGWPLNVFLTPEGDPLIGATYVPREPFAALLKRLQSNWAADSARLRRVAAQARSMLAAHRDSVLPGALLDAPARQALVMTFRQQLLGVADRLGGGFGDQSKFPSVPQLRALASLVARGEQPGEREFLRLTLQKMARQGLRDQIGGGFFRYVTDPDWQSPHFEKMLYDNAQLIELFADASHAFPGADGAYFASVARNTADFLLREMQDPRGAFVASLSSVDADGQEGRPYVLDRDELAVVLPPEIFRSAVLSWGFERPPVSPHGRLPLEYRTPEEVAARLDLSPQRVREQLSEARTRVLEARAGREVPRDGKVLAGWNGLVLAALSRVSVMSDGPDGPDGQAYRRAGLALRNYLATRLWDGEQVFRMRSASGPAGQAGLRDYVYLARGFLAWAELTGSSEDRALAAVLLEQAWARFHSEDGWHLSDAALITHGPAYVLLADGALPSPTALWAEAAIALAAQGGDATLALRGRQLLGIDLPELAENAFFHASHVRLLAAHE